jgi:hypothetical protein
VGWGERERKRERERERERKRERERAGNKRFKRRKKMDACAVKEC